MTYFLYYDNALVLQQSKCLYVTIPSPIVFSNVIKVDFNRIVVHFGPQPNIDPNFAIATSDISPWQLHLGFMVRDNVALWS